MQRPLILASVGFVCLAAPLFAEDQSLGLLESRPLAGTMLAPASWSQPILPVEPAAPRLLDGRFLVGAIWGQTLTPDAGLGSQVRRIPVFRALPRHSGWRPAFGLSWFTGEIAVPVNGSPLAVAEAAFRPVMGGVGYAIRQGPTLTTLSLVGGYAFNRATVSASLPEGVVATVRVGNAWAVRPNASVVWALTRRLAVIGSVGYVVMRPTMTVGLTQADHPVWSATGRRHADYVSVAIGAAASVF
jgi:hypothetical protein